MNRGDRLLVNLTNNLPNATTLHWHGMFQNRTNWMDGTSGVTQCPVPPGKSFIYNFTVENQFGTYWYHAHFSTQYTDGIIGPLIIHAPEEAQTRQLYDYDQVVMMQDWYHDLTSGLIPVYLAPDNENNEPVPDNGLIQGEGYYNCSNLDPDSGYECADNSTRAVFSITQNKRYRLRFINAGAITTFQISVDNHTLDVIEADGVLTEPLPVHRFDIAVAERYSVILNANQSSSSNYWIRAWMNLNCFAGSTDSLDPNVKALITYTNTTSAPTNSVDWDDALDIVCQDLNNTLLVPSDIQQAPPADVLYQVSFSFGIRDNALDRAYINGTSWSANIENPTLNQAVSGLQASNVNFTKVGVVSSAYSSNQLVISLPTVQVVDILIQNFDDGSHPFHLHGHVFWVMATSVEQYFPWDTDYYNQLNSTTTNDYNKNPMRRDTLVIPEYGWALIRFRNDNPGQWALHCHISWHMEAGLFMQFVSLQDEIKALGLPSDVLALCNSTST
jgi:FtsP/CotA-like multicopper oxidase with cupredoxin domain